MVATFPQCRFSYWFDYIISVKLEKTASCWYSNVPSHVTVLMTSPPVHCVNEEWWANDDEPDIEPTSIMDLLNTFLLNWLPRRHSFIDRKWLHWLGSIEWLHDFQTHCALYRDCPQPWAWPRQDYIGVLLWTFLAAHMLLSASQRVLFWLRF